MSFLSKLVAGAGERSAAGYGFSLGIIPVQEWIGEARRSKDLRSGSTILSWLMASILTELKRAGAVIKVPRPPSEGFFEELAQGGIEAALSKTYGIPNRASGEFPAEAGLSSSGVDEILGSLQEKVDSAWQELKDQFLTAETVKNRISGLLIEPLGSYLAETPAGADCPFSLLWVRVELTAESSEDVTKTLDRLYSEVKRTRPIRPWRWGADVGKCNQCGSREAMGPVESFADWRTWHDRLARSSHVKAGRRLEANERLCWVCLTKRLVGYSGSGDAFPSTGEIATALWRGRLKDSGLEERLSAIAATAAGKEDLGRALLASAESLSSRLEQEDFDALLQARDALKREIRRQNRSLSADEQPIALDPPRYLALITYDGDDMGKHLQRNREGASAGMSEFATAVADQLPGFGARAFYLGGDEGLVMTPAETALPLALAVREKFDGALGGLDPSPTLSAGVAFFEYSQPLGAAIGAAREALHRAKSLRRSIRKNALGVAVETASGSRWVHVDHWGDHWRALFAMVRMIGEGSLSAGWPHDAAEFLRSLKPSDWNDREIAEAARAELARLFRRRVSVSGKSRQERLQARRDAWTEAGQGRIWSGTAPREGAEPLHLVAFLARHWQGRAAVEEGRRES